MKKIFFGVVILFSISINSFSQINNDDYNVDKDNLQNLINGVSSLKAGVDIVQVVYNFENMIDNKIPLKLGVSLLDLTTIANNVSENNMFERIPDSFLPKAFVGLSFFNYAIGYQFNILGNQERDNIRANSSYSHSHSFSFGGQVNDFYFNIPMSFVTGPNSFFPGQTAFSLTPEFGFLFRGGFVPEFSFAVHYGMSFPSPTDTVNNTTIRGNPISIGADIKTTVSLSGFTSKLFEITMPMELRFRYGISSILPDIDAGYASEILTNTLLDGNDKATDSIYVSVLVPLKLSSTLGAITIYGMPKIFSFVYVYKTDVLYNVDYGIEAGLELILVEDLIISFAGYAGGNTVTKEQKDSGLISSFSGGLDLWVKWDF